MDTDGRESEALLNYLCKLGLEEFYPNKLTLQFFLEINKDNIYEEEVESLKKIPWCFLRKLFKISAECRNYIQLNDDNNDEESIYLSDCDNNEDNDFLTTEDSADNKINPLDLIVALFLCADSFLQQEMVLKMSMCQFPVPLLLPHGNNSQCTLMLWALREIVKEWRPHHLIESRGFVENSIVQTDTPFYSFVRLKNCSLSKSQLLNHVLSRDQQNQNIFIHREMKGGTNEREIASGLVEVCWCLPSGVKNLDIFPEPVCFANLRGDICESLAQYSFLLEVSSATFIFLDKVEEEENNILTSLQDVKSKLHLVICKKENVRQDMMTVKTLAKALNVSKNRLNIKGPQENVTEFSEKLCASIRNLKKEGNTVVIENLLDKAIELGLFVDEITSDTQKKEAEETMNGIRVNKMTVYKNRELPLQGVNWKTLSNLEMEECRLKKCSDQGVEEYKCKLQEDKEKIRNEHSKYKLTTAMRCFIKYLSEKDKNKRDFFLKWMKYKLNTNLQSANELASLRDKLKEECNKEKKDMTHITELYQNLLESSLGIEHYLREMGLTYEFSNSTKAADQIAHLPVVAAEMLLDGYPLELLDGDASNIPERWVTDVLMELHKKVGEKSRLLVLTVLGVQSTGKSTLLNTMFGVQFPVSSGRCTRGAYMLFLRVGEDMKNELNCDFIVLIDTEGLKSPHLAELEDSYEHDNQLATFVIGLSDVTIINVAMENSTEMKDVLQIATHAFLRMNTIGKKPVCHFVHQNVAAVSAHDKTMAERKHLLEQLNEMTKIAAEMENLVSIKTFTDVLEYDMDKNNWNIPGLWRGTPPMAPVNTGYSEAVADFKRNILETMSGDRGRENIKIPEFLEWMKSLWKAVKYENFLFSFRNTLVAHAYDNLCKEFCRWEWEFRREIFSWQKATELEIHNTDTEPTLQHLSDLVKSKKSKASEEITAQEKIMKQKLEKYYKRKEIPVHLLLKYQSDFLNSIKSLVKEMQHSVNNKLDQALELSKKSKELQDKINKFTEVIEEQVLQLLSDCKQSTLSDEELTDEFEKMWTKETNKVTGLKEQNICENILKLLRASFLNRKVNEFFENIGDLTEIGRSPFKVKLVHIEGAKALCNLHFYLQKDVERELQKIADNTIDSCRQILVDVTKKNTDYHESFTKDLLDKVEESLKPHKKLCKTRFEFDLKLHICGFASREFVQMHRQFLSDNHPRTQLEEFKTQYLSDFLNLYKLSSKNETDDCESKATNFVQYCIKPAVEEFIRRSLGIDIVDEILISSKSEEFSSRSFFQYNILKELLQKEDFEGFIKYNGNYEIYVKEWISQHILQKMSHNKTLLKLKNRNLQLIIPKIEEAITKASEGEDSVLLPDTKESITELISNMRKYLIKDISISVEAEKITLFQIQSTCHPFINSLKVSIKDLKEQLEEEFSKSEDISNTLNKLPVKPQDELFNRVFGCGKQCPFCKVPCDVVLREHNKHCAAVHRPQGLGRYRIIDTQKLVETLCSTDVHSQRKFKNTDTKWECHPYKDYTKFYPDWHIPPDPTIEASDYWKYVLVQYNDRFAEEYKAKPADVPKAWTRITKDQALKSLNDAFKNLQP
ncbi:up-regulator of cell proliferation-like [Anabas testudineus]|uniref:Uncharacterized protein n=1 Tax=Anabas testudineus TaxID=64144 RepID=A0A3Q1K0Z9_ANATE|nr:up-regulator of cell proliferation-like [Anabas testudineus]